MKDEQSLMDCSRQGAHKHDHEVVERLIRMQVPSIMNAGSK
jgi:hypothetical protein